MFKLPFQQKILSLEDNPEEFDALALSICTHQKINNPIYKAFTNLISKDLVMPFLPIQFFKTEIVKTGNWKEEMIFQSSGTSQTLHRSLHHMESIKWYDTISSKLFESQFRKLKDFPILALLPSYLERNNSSLVAMVQNFMNISKHDANGFYLDNLKELIETIRKLNQANQKGMLIGVSFALLDMASEFDLDLEGWIVIETGGMKGRKKEMIREELHSILGSAFNLNEVYSEYGMTELTSQAYSTGEGVFDMNQFMRVKTMQIDDPFQECKNGQIGRICIIDLGNIHSCCFIATDDLGRLINENQFTIEGRLDQSDLRGCNLLYH